jgi:hypothetical protein
VFCVNSVASRSCVVGDEGVASVWLLVVLLVLSLDPPPW